MKYLIVAIFLVGFTPLTHGKETFEQWKKSYAKRAAKHGIPTSFSMKYLKDIKPDPSVIKKDRNQVTSSKTIDYQKFIKRWLRKSPSRLEQAQRVYKENYRLLKKVEKKYGVDKEAIIALWGVETFFGKITGSYDLIRSLATLSWDGRRRRFFETQLNATLRLLRQGHAKREELKGSWAGATGHCQFMPSNVPVYAVDFDGDGRKNIWSSKPDIFGSIANYLKKVGWEKGKSIGSLAMNTKNKDIDLTKYRSKKEYNRLGFRTIDGKLIKEGNWRKRKASKISMKNSPVVLRGSNYRPLMRWNASSLFAAFNILIINELKKTSF